METEDETQVTAGVVEVDEPLLLEVAHLKLIDGLERRWVGNWEVVVAVDGIQVRYQYPLCI